jgi:hypothetical protein
MKNFKKFLRENIQFDETNPEYYLKYYKDNEIFTSVNIITYKEIEYTGIEYRKLFMYWYDKIKPFLDKNDEYGANDVLIDWNEETLAKFDLYTLIKKYFKK